MTEAPARPARPAIVVVDSEVLVRHAIADYLRNCGYMVIEAGNSDETLAILAKPELMPAAILCDAALAGTMNGFALARHVRSHWPGLPVILAGSLDAAANAAADLCDNGPKLARPYDPQAVAAALKQRLAKRHRGLA